LKKNYSKENKGIPILSNTVVMVKKLPSQRGFSKSRNFKGLIKIYQRPTLVEMTAAIIVGIKAAARSSILYSTKMCNRSISLIQ